MKTFIFEDVKELTEYYHPQGGAVVIAKDLERAYDLLPKVKGIVPDYEYDCEGEEKVFIFKDSGCC